MRTHERIPKTHPVQPLKRGAKASDRATCGHCGLSWDDGKVTSITPTPAGRCAFEEFHVYEDDDTEPTAPDKMADALRSAIGTLKARRDTAAKVVAQECREALGEPARRAGERADLLEALADGVEMALAALPDASFANDDAERLTVQYLTDLSRRAKGLPPQYGVKRP